jgi:hypothetical protein
MPPRDLTAEDIATWITPHEALDILRGSFGEEILLEAVLIQRLKGGMVQGVAGHIAWEGNARPRQALVTIPSEYWEQYSYQTHDAFWQTSDIQLYVPNFDGRHNSSHITLYSVRFEPEGVRAITTSAPKKLAPSKPAGASAKNQNKGGRPPKEWWDDLWVEIFRQIYAGELVPKKQADIELAMLEWATNHGHDLSEAAARKPARKLFAALNSEG